METSRCNTILVTGGAGYIGSHTVYVLLQEGYMVVVLDKNIQQNRLDGPVYIQGDCGDKTLLHSIFKQYNIIGVMHFAAFIQVGESVKNPLVYYENNVSKTLVLLQEMLAHGIARFIFSSSSAVYGIPRLLPLTEDHPKDPISPYGKTKLVVESVLQDLATSDDLQSVALRYFNAAGALPEKGIGERHDPETHIIPLVVRAARNELPFTIFGTDYATKDGTCVRDYVHVYDIAQAHVHAMRYLLAGGTTAAFNLGTGHGYSVKEIVATMKQVAGKDIIVKNGVSRSGDPATLVSDSSRAQMVLGWQPYCSSLLEMLHSAYAFEQVLSNKEE